jgi:GNAT superfamily N-acetyltransferase
VPTRVPTGGRPSGTLTSQQTSAGRFFVVEHGRGYGSALLHAVIDSARDQGKHWVRLNCWSSNTRLHECYLERGFQYVRTSDVAGRISGALFQKDLRSS